MANFEQEKLDYEGKRELVEEGVKLLKEAIEDMKENAKAQHEVDKSNFAKIKEETKKRHEAAIQAGKEAAKLRK